MTKTKTEETPVLYTPYEGAFFEILPLKESSVKSQLVLKEIVLGKDKEGLPIESFIYLESHTRHFKVHSLLFPDGKHWDAYNGWNDEKGSPASVTLYQEALKAQK